ncbi:helix-turn-helix transcriptional regulator, partial [Vibrio anguillarum]
EGKKMTEKQIAELLTSIKSLTNQTKEIMTISECSLYTGLSKSYLYKLTHKEKIPFSKPLGKRVYFERSKIDQWLLRNNKGGFDEAS